MEKRDAKKVKTASEKVMTWIKGMKKNVYLCSRFQGSVLRLPVSPVL